MKAAQFEHHEPTTVDEAVSLMQGVENPTVLAGGQSLVPMMRFRLAQPDTVIDINGIDDLDYLRIEADGGGEEYLRVGALVRHSEIEDSTMIARDYGSFADTAPLIGDPQVRNRGTVVGSLAQGDPKGDWGAVALAHDAELVAHGPDGKRVIPSEDFFLLPYDTALEDDELLTEVRVPVASEREGSAYHKIKRKVGDFATVGVATRVVLGENGAIETARVALTSVDITNVRAREAEAILEGERPSSDLFGEAGEAASEESNPETDEHGSASYKENMVRVLTQRALADGVERTGLARQLA